MWQTIYILSTIFMCISAAGIVLWVFRPNSKAKYDECSMIPLQEDNNINKKEDGEGK